MKRRLLLVAGALVALVVLRAAVEPKETPDPFPGFDAKTKEALRAELPVEVQDAGVVPSLVAKRRVLLVGEVHKKNETQRFLANLLAKLGDQETVLLLELSKKSQPGLDRFLSTGEKAQLDPVFAQRANLPIRFLVEHAWEMRPRVKRVVAMDENQSSIALHRLFLTDTRNDTMARAIVDAYHRYPKARIVAYGGQMHMLLAGRYRYDDASRSPAGARILGMGIPRSDVYSLMLAGKGHFPLEEVWQSPGVVTTAGKAGDLPYYDFINGAIFGEPRARGLFDAFVNLGELTATS